MLAQSDRNTEDPPNTGPSNLEQGGRTVSQTSTDIDPQELREVELGAATILERLAPARPATASSSTSPPTPDRRPAEAEPQPGRPAGPRPLGVRELAAGAIGASLGVVLVLIGIAVALSGAWAALTGSELLFWSWAEPATGTGIALIVLGLPVAVYAACTVWLCILFVPLLTFRLARSLLDRG